MKKIFIFLTISILATISCKRNDIIAPPTANILIANAVVGGATLTFNPLTTTIGNNASASFPIYAGQSPVSLSNNAITPAASYYNQTITTVDAGNYTLFLGGASPLAVDPVLVTESYKNYTDSLCGVRFINLSPNSNPISVNITGNANGSEVTSLVYKAYSSFKQYPAKKINTTYSFQIKDGITGNLITSYTLTTPYFHNVTIMLIGLVGGSPAAGATLVKHP